MVRIFVRLVIAHNVNSFHQPQTWAKMQVLTAGTFSGRIARGSVAPRKMACRPAVKGVS